MFLEKTQEEIDKMSATEYQTYCTQKSEHEANLRMMYAKVTIRISD